MGKLILILSITLFFSGCTSKKLIQDNTYYDRANEASSESLEGLDRE